MAKTFLYVSNWNEFGGTPGIGLYEFDENTGKLAFVKDVNTTIPYGVTYVDKQRGIIYFANETENNPAIRAGGGGRIYAYRVDKATGDLAEINHVDTLCPNPCYISMDENGKYMIVANHSGFNTATKVEKDAYGKYYVNVVYSDATIDLFRINDDGSIGELLDVVKHEGSGPSPRQLSAHPHSATRSPSGKLYGVVDKGCDTISFYEIENEKLKLVAMPYGIKKGSAPRYLIYHPTAPYFYVNHESCMLVRSFKYDENGNIAQADEISTLPDGFVPGSGRPGELQGFAISKDGRHIYVTLHRPSMVAVIDTDANTGGLTLRQNVELPTEWPRCCVLSPDEKFLVVGSLKNGEIYVFSVGEDGLLQKTDAEYRQPAPSSMTFYTVD